MTCHRHSFYYAGDPARLVTARGSAPPSPAARVPATCAAMGAGGERQPRHWAGTCANRRAPGAAHRGNQRITPAATRHARTRSARCPTPSAGAPAADHARGAVAAVLPHWSHDDGRLPGGRLTRPLPPPANGHGRGVWCELRNRTASARWAPRLPGQPASRLHPHALRRAAFDHFDPDRRGLWARHADTHAQAVLIRRRPIPAA